MDFLAALALSYMLFPANSPYQELLIRQDLWQPETRESLMQKRSEIRQALYPHGGENCFIYGDEVFSDLENTDNTSFSTEGQEDDGVDFPEELLHPKYGPQSEGSALALGTDSVGEKMLLNSQERLRMFEYGEEQFAYKTGARGSKSLVSVNSKYITQDVLDDNFNIVSKKKYHNGSSLEKSDLAFLGTYAYRKVTEDGKTRDVVMKRTDRDYEKDLENIFEFNSKGFCIKETHSVFVDDMEKYNRQVSEALEKDPEADVSKIKKSRKKQLDFVVLRTYDSKNRVLSEEEQKWYYDEIPAGICEKKKNVYQYRKENLPPDYKYYENGILRMWEKHETDDLFTREVYFDDDIRVVSKYNRSVKISEEFIYGGDDE